MPEPRGYALSPEFAADVRETVDIVKSDYRNSAPPGPKRPNASPQNIQRCKISSSTPTVVSADEDDPDAATTSYFAARVRTFNSTTCVWSDLTDYDAVQVFDPSGGSFNAGDECEGRQCATVDLPTEDDETQQWPVFEKIGGGSPGGAAICTIVTKVKNPDDLTQHHAHLHDVDTPPISWGSGPGDINTYPRLYLARISRFLYPGDASPYVWLWNRRLIPEWNFQFPEAIDWMAVNSGFPITGTVKRSYDGGSTFVDETHTLPVYETTEDRPSIWVKIGAASGTPPSYSAWTPVRSQLADGPPSSDFTDIIGGNFTPFQWHSFGTAYEDNDQLVDATAIVRLRPDPSGTNAWRFQAPVLAPCPDVPDCPEGYTSSQKCRYDFIGSRCVDGVTQYQRVIFFFTSPPITYTSDWSDSVPVDPFA
jgi:hypothetical protein